MTFLGRDPLLAAQSRASRRARLVSGTLRLANGSLINIVVRNLSEHGMGVSSRSKPPKLDEAVIISLPGAADVAGIVRWVRNLTFGVELTGEIDQDAIAAAIQAESTRLQADPNWTVSTMHRVRATPDLPKRRLF